MDALSNIGISGKTEPSHTFINSFFDDDFAFLFNLFHFFLSASSSFLTFLIFIVLYSKENSIRTLLNIKHK
ncbi:unnamed protein product [Haemonchus placei]|uniref:7TM_GPCR_Srx domain-containing protein n=1 Tax=Haemonchus placei TaxID=6290 RepID=A0A158QM68_HAEPC|nr:unnamed protein product [Haemonchus placei]